MEPGCCVSLARLESTQSVNVISTILSFVCSEKNPHHFQGNASFYSTNKAESVWMDFNLIVKHEV